MLDSYGNPLPLNAQSIFYLVFYSLSIVTTLARLVHRTWRQQLWWDDFWAGIAAISTTFLTIRHCVTFGTSIHNKPIAVQSFLVWVPFLMYPACLWSARLALAVTVVRFFAPGYARNLTKLACWTIGIMGCANIIQKIWMCGSHVYAVPLAYKCTFTLLTPVLGFVTNTIANAWLIGWPAFILLRINLPRTYRRLLTACFSASFSVAVVDIVHDVYVLRNDFKHGSITGHINVALAVILCNLVVLVSYIYRMFREPEGSTYDTMTGGIGGSGDTNTILLERRKQRKYRGVVGTLTLSFRGNETEAGRTTNGGIITMSPRDEKHDTRDSGESSSGGRCSRALRKFGKSRRGEHPTTTTTTNHQIMSFASSTGPLTSLSSAGSMWEDRWNDDDDDDDDSDKRRSRSGDFDEEHGEGTETGTNSIIDLERRSSRPDSRSRSTASHPDCDETPAMPTPPEPPTPPPPVVYPPR